MSVQFFCVSYKNANFVTRYILYIYLSLDDLSVIYLIFLCIVVLCGLKLIEYFHMNAFTVILKMETLCFRLPGHGDKTLKHMNSLRCSKHFCDITIIASNKQTFKGHKVVLAACSPFLRDQFLLNPSPNLQVNICQHTMLHYKQQCNFIIYFT